MQTDAQLDAIFGALAHPIRRAILARLTQDEATVNALAEPFQMSLPAISNHIRVLETAGLIERGRRAQFRPCRLRPEALRAVRTWTDFYEPIWQDRFDRMETLLKTGKDQNDD